MTNWGLFSDPLDGRSATVDTFCMATTATLEIGDDVLVVVETNGERTSVIATVTGVFTESLLLAPDAAALVDGAVPLTVLLTKGGESSYASVSGFRREGWALEVRTGMWRRVLNRRAAPRYPVSYECQLDFGGETLDGRLVDLSDRGAAIECDHWREEYFDVLLLGLRIPCRAVAIEPLAIMVIVHVAFAAPGELEIDAIAKLVEEARLEFTAGQRQLAQRTGSRPEWASPTGRRNA